MHTPARRVAVTGIGTVSAAGLGKEAFWRSIAGADDPPASCSITAFDPSPWFTKSEARRSDPYVMYAVAAASLAYEDAGSPTLEASRSGAVLGNLYGAAASVEAQQGVLEREGADAVAPWLSAVSCEDACATQVALRFGLRGPSKLVIASCASGSFAVGDGAALVAQGTCDAVFAGATFGPITDVLRASYENLRVVSRSGVVRPFDARRDGFTFADGAAVLLLEDLEHARGRGARILAEVAGHAQTNDAFHVSNPSGEGIEASMRLAVHAAGLTPADVVHVNAHGTGTVTGDRTEAEAIHRVFGRPGPAVTSIKGVTGHSLAAAGAFEAVAVVLSFAHRQIPPAGTAVEFDPEIAALVDVVHGAPRPWEPGPSVSNSFGLGGQNASIVLLPATT